MKKLFSVAIVLFALFQVLPSCGETQEPKELTEATNSYNAELQNAVKPVNDRYLPKLDELKKRLIFKGDIRGAVEVEDVVTKMGGGQSLEQQSDKGPQELIEIKKSYMLELETAIRPITSLYLAKLDVLKQQLALNGALRSALAVEEEIGKIKAKKEHAPQADKVIFYDDFHDSRFNSNWKWIRKNAAIWNIANDQLEITASSWGDLWTNNNTASLMYLLEPRADYAVETYIMGDPSKDHQQAGIVIYNTDDNYIRLTIGHIEGQIIIVWSSEYNGEFDRGAFALISSVNTKIRIEKRSKAYSAYYYDEDSRKWEIIGSSLSPFFSADANKIAVAVLASPTPITFAFKYFKVETIRE